MLISSPFHPPLKKKKKTAPSKLQALLNILFIFSCFLTLAPPVCFQTPCTHIMVLAGRERLHLSLPPSLSLSLSGLWRRESLLRILALLHHNTHDVSTFHTHIFSQQLLKTFLHMHGTKLAQHGAQRSAGSSTPRCTPAPLPGPHTPNTPPPTCSPCKVLCSFFFFFLLATWFKNCGKFNFYFAL